MIMTMEGIERKTEAGAEVTEKVERVFLKTVDD